MPQTPTGITLGAYLANPSLLQQQAAARKQAMLAQLLANYQPAAITNPSPTGAFLQNLAASLTPALGAYLAGKSLDTESKLQENQLAAQLGNARSLFGLPTDSQPPAGAPSLPGPVVVSPEMNLPASAWSPTAASPENEQGRQLLATALAGVTPPAAATESANAPLAAAAKALNLTPEQAYTWYINDKESFMKSAGEALQPTPRQKEYAGWGISNPEAAALERAERIKGAMQSGGIAVMTPQGPRVMTVPGAAEANAGYQYQEKRATGQAGMETTLTEGYDPETGQYRTQTAANAASRGGLPPRPSPGATAALELEKYRQQQKIALEKEQALVPTEVSKGQQLEQSKADIVQQQKNVEQWSTEAESGYGMRQILAPQIAQLDDAIKSGSYGPGVLTNTWGTIGRFMDWAGFGEEWGAVKQNIFNRTFDQKSKMAAMAALNNKLGVGVSTKDVEFVMDNMPKVQDSPQAAKDVLATLNLIAATKQARYDQWGQYHQLNPSGTPDQFNHLWIQRTKEHPDMQGKKTGRIYIWNVVTNRYESP